MISLTPANTPVRRRASKPAGATSPTCRDEVVAALVRLADRTGDEVFTGGQIYSEMLRVSTRYTKSTVLKTMQRMKEPPSGRPYARLQQVRGVGFRLVGRPRPLAAGDHPVGQGSG